MELPKLDINRPESLILFCVSIISVIAIYIRNTTVSEYLYFYLCNISLLILILAVISFTSFIFRVYTSSIPMYFLIFTSIYTILTGIYWYFGLSLFEKRNYVFY